MQVIELTRRQIKKIYRTRMVKDFPEAERKPLGMILKARRKGRYVCLGLEENNEILGYAFFVKIEEDYLFDYLAISEEMRNKNLGTTFLTLIGERFKNASSVIGEVENPEYANDEAERNIRTRRIDFYMRNGVIDTGVRTKTFGVEFLILEMKLGSAHTKEQIKTLYEKQYRIVLPDRVYDKNIIIY